MAAKKAKKKNKKTKTIKFDTKAPNASASAKADNVIADLVDAKSDYLPIFEDQGRDKLIAYLKSGADPYFLEMKGYYNRLKPFAKLFAEV